MCYFKSISLQNRLLLVEVKNVWIVDLIFLFSINTLRFYQRSLFLCRSTQALQGMPCTWSLKEILYLLSIPVFGNTSLFWLHLATLTHTLLVHKNTNLINIAGYLLYMYIYIYYIWYVSKADVKGILKNILLDFIAKSTSTSRSDKCVDSNRFHCKIDFY